MNINIEDSIISKSIEEPLYLSYKDKCEISFLLERYHSIFDAFWQIGRPIFSNRAKTAQIEFDKEGKEILFVINYQFWKNLSEVQKLFLICHECLHCVLKHGIRTKDVICKPEFAENLNISADIEVNELLVSKFGFSRNEVDPENKFVFINNIFEENNLIKRDESLEYYYLQINKETDKSKFCFNDHKYLIGIDGSEQGDGNGDNDLEEEENTNVVTVEDVVNDLISENLTEDQKKDFENKSGKKISKALGGCGNEENNAIKIISAAKVKKNFKFLDLINDILMKKFREVNEESEQWIKPNRRFMMLLGDSSDIFLPTDNEIDKEEKKKPELALFLDTSGSCSSLSTRFFRIAESVPEDKFCMKVYGFSTSVYEVDMKDRKLHGFGGTSFSCIEYYINKKYKKYPDLIFVITDGCAPKPLVKDSKKWHWFLSSRNTSSIPDGSHIHFLKDFENE